MPNRPKDKDRKKYIFTLDIKTMEHIQSVAKRSHLSTSYVVECVLKHNLYKVDFVTFKVVDKQ